MGFGERGDAVRSVVGWKDDECNQLITELFVSPCWNLNAVLPM
jgi:hypothetical protein